MRQENWSVWQIVAGSATPTIKFCLSLWATLLVLLLSAAYAAQPEPKVEPNSQQSPEKRPIPGDAAQKKSLATIREVYKEDYKDKAALAEKLIQKADETKKDPIDRFVLLQEAKNLAADTGQVDAAFRAVDKLASEYAVFSLGLKAAVFAKAAKTPSLTPEQKTAMAEAALMVMDEALVQDNFDVAKKVGRNAIQLVRRSKEKELFLTLAGKNKEVEAAAKAYANAQEAMAILKEKPDDPDANTTVGKYLCLSKGDFAKGLAMLALGSDAKLKVLAETDKNGATTTEEQVKLGDAWWDAGGKKRAGYWYHKAMRGLSGLEKDRVGARLSPRVGATSADMAEPVASGNRPKVFGHTLMGVQSEQIVKLAYARNSL